MDGTVRGTLSLPQFRNSKFKQIESFKLRAEHYWVRPFDFSAFTFDVRHFCQTKRYD